MRTMRFLCVFASACAGAVAVSACSSDETTTATPDDGGASDATSETITRRDAGTGEEDVAPGCNGGAAPDPLSFEATVVDPPSRSERLSGATVELVRRSDRSVITTATTDANGQVKLSAPTGGVALDALLRITASPGDAGPRTPFINEFQHGLQADQAPVGLATPATSFFAGAAEAVGVTLDPAKTIVQVHFGNCLHAGFSGAKIAIEGATVFYNKGGPMSFDTSATTTGIIGVGTAFNVTPGPTKITVTHEGQTTTHEANTLAGENYFVFMNP